MAENNKIELIKKNRNQILKYDKNMAEDIAEQRKDPDKTIMKICEDIGINISTFYDWKRNNIEFRKMIEEAEKIRTEYIGDMGEQSLVKLIKGYDYEEHEISNSDQFGETKKTITKHKPPDNTCVIFTVKSIKEEQYKDRSFSTVDQTITVKRRLLDDE